MLKRALAAVQAEEQTRKIAEQVEAQRLKAERVAQASAAKAAKAAEKVRKTYERHEAQRMRIMRIAESAHGRQGHKGSVDIEACEEQGPRLDFSSLVQQQVPQYFFGSHFPFTPVVSNNQVPVHHFGTHLQSTLPSHPL